MSLDNIQLPAFVLHDLFKHSLIDLNSNEISPPDPPKDELHYLGGNEKHIIILINNSGEIFLPDDQLNFLTDILSACNLTLADIALLNLNKTPAINYELINSTFKPEFLILFGVLPIDIQLPFQVPAFQLQQFNGQMFLPVPSLNGIQTNQDHKKQLWTRLKQLFLS